jgi:hypothetical protein
MPLVLAIGDPRHRTGAHPTGIDPILLADDNSTLILPDGLVPYPSADGIGAAISNPLHPPRPCA